MAGPNAYLRLQVRAHALSTGEPRTKPVYNVYDFRRTVLTGSPSKTQAVTAFKTAILTPLQAVLSVSYVTDWIDVRWLDDPLDPYVTAALALNGTVTGDSLPSLNNVYVKLGSGLRGQSNRGSKHYGPIAESQATLDQLTSGAQALWVTFCNALVAGFTAADGFVYKPFIVSQLKSKFNPTTATVVGIDMTTAAANVILGMMRRRAEFRRSSI